MEKFLLFHSRRNERRNVGNVATLGCRAVIQNEEVTVRSGEKTKTRNYPFSLSLPFNIPYNVRTIEL